MNALRELVLALQRNEDSTLAASGRYLGAAFGALSLAKGSERPARLLQASELMSMSVAAWLRYARTAEIDSSVSGAFRLLCDDGERALSGDSQARQAFDQRVRHIRAQLGA